MVAFGLDTEGTATGAEGAASGAEGEGVVCEARFFRYALKNA